MSKIKIDLPTTFSHSFIIPVRITDLNYGSHVGNDAMVSIIHEARMQYLQSYQFSELNIGGAGLIMRDLVIEFKKEIFYPAFIEVHVAIANPTNASFDIFYKLSILNSVPVADVAYAKTRMVAYDYTNKKVVALPENFRGLVIQ
jgi:acyl-CoA thioesterase FadM